VVDIKDTTISLVQCLVDGNVSILTNVQHSYPEFSASKGSSRGVSSAYSDDDSAVAGEVWRTHSAGPRREKGQMG
jgi:hypothetical protein